MLSVREEIDYDTIGFYLVSYISNETSLYRILTEQPIRLPFVSLFAVLPSDPSMRFFR